MAAFGNFFQTVFLIQTSIFGTNVYKFRKKPKALMLLQLLKLTQHNYFYFFWFLTCWDLSKILFGQNFPKAAVLNLEQPKWSVPSISRDFLDSGHISNWSNVHGIQHSEFSVILSLYEKYPRQGKINFRTGNDSSMQIKIL